MRQNFYTYGPKMLLLPIMLYGIKAALKIKDRINFLYQHILGNI